MSKTPRTDAVVTTYITGMYGSVKTVPIEFVRNLEAELSEKDERIKELEKESIKMEEACMALPGFDTSGPGDCADRQIAAIDELARKAEKLEFILKANLSRNFTCVIVL